MSKGWTSLDIPSQCDKRAIVTGATSGIGWQTALELARAGALVVLTARTEEKADNAAKRIREILPDAKLETAVLDVASLASVKAFAAQQMQEGHPLDILLNNAGVMALPKRELTVDGFEMQFATNMLGPFALTGQLLPSLLQAAAPRVVSVASLAHISGGPVPVKDLNSEQSYKPMKAYSKTKLEIILFAQELQRRAEGRLLSVSCHPGYARTNLQFVKASLPIKAASFVSLPLAQNAAGGAQPSLFAATSPQAKPAGYYGPDGLFGFKGPVKETKPSKDAGNQEAAQQLFEQLEQLSGVHYNL